MKPPRMRVSHRRGGGLRTKFRSAPTVRCQVGRGQLEKMSWPRKLRGSGHQGWSKVKALEPREAFQETNASGSEALTGGSSVLAKLRSRP